MELLEACVAEAHQQFIPSSDDAHSWEPVPWTLRDILKIPDGVVKSAWLATVKKELKTLVDAQTFIIDLLLNGEVSIPDMEIFKVKIMIDGSLDKLKGQMGVRGDL